MEKSGLFKSINGDRMYKVDFFAEYFASFIGNGIFPEPSSGLQSVSNNNMAITIKGGQGWINGYYYANTDDLLLNVDVADGVLNRIDRVVLRYDIVNREIIATVKKGSFASSPVAQDLQRDTDIYELGIADIYIAAGATSISQSDITDLRFNTELCGVVKGTIEEIDTTDLFAQYQDAFNTWFDDMKDQLSTDAAGNLQLQVDNKVDKGCTWGELAGVS